MAIDERFFQQRGQLAFGVVLLVAGNVLGWILSHDARDLRDPWALIWSFALEIAGALLILLTPDPKEEDGRDADRD